MIQRKIPRDIAKYESKLIGPFTTRQVVCLVPALSLAVGAYFLFRDQLGDTALFVSVMLAIPFFLFGWYKPSGVPFEVYISKVAYNAFIAPTKRGYKSKNTFEGILVEEVEKAKTGKKYKSKDPDLKEIK